jgi:hypothetical protein
VKRITLTLSAIGVSVCLVAVLGFSPGNAPLLNAKASGMLRSTSGVNTGGKATTENTFRNSVSYLADVLYDRLNLARAGLNRSAFQYAYRGQQYLAEKGMLEKNSLLTICDFTQPSNRKRLYVIDTRNDRLLMNTYVAHGKNSGVVYANRFSNRPESKQSSLGFYVTRDTYFGKHGLSLRLEGLEQGYNSNALSRDVVVHGAPYIGRGHRAAYMGRSFGCPAVPDHLAPELIRMIKEGSCLFIYHPTRSYLNHSKILNG